MKAKVPQTLLQRWERALDFRIRENGCESIDQLPNPLAFPERLLNRIPEAHISLGRVLAAGLLKLTRPCPLAVVEAVELGYCGLWLDDYANFAGRVAKYENGHTSEVRSDFGEYLRAGFFDALGVFIELAMLAPDRLSELHARIDELDNAMLHELAMRAVQGQADDFDIFAGLYR